MNHFRRAAALNRTAVALCAVWVGTALALDDSRRWPDETRIETLVCHADFDLSSHQKLLGETAGLQSDLVETLRLPPAREPIHVFLFQKQTPCRGRGS